MSGARTVGFIEWREDMEKLPERLMEEGKKIVGQGCNNIKKEWRMRWSGHATIKHLPHTITYDVTVPRENYIHGEVGPDLLKRGQAPLAHIIEYGLGSNEPLPGLLPAHAAEEPRFLKHVEDLLPRLLEPRT